MTCPESHSLQGPEQELKVRKSCSKISILEITFSTSPLQVQPFESFTVGLSLFPLVFALILACINYLSLCKHLPNVLTPNRMYILAHRLCRWSWLSWFFWPRIYQKVTVISKSHGEGGSAMLTHSIVDRKQLFAGASGSVFGQNLLKQALYNMAVGFIQVDEKGMPSKCMDRARDREDCQKVFKIVYGIIIKCWPQEIAWRCGYQEAGIKGLL